MVYLTFYLIIQFFWQADSFDIDRECSESPREATPDSDSGYMASCVVVSSSSSVVSHLPRQDSSGAAGVPTSPGAMAKPSFLSEMQAKHRAAAAKAESPDPSQVQAQAPPPPRNSNKVTSPSLPKGAVMMPGFGPQSPPGGGGNSLADQLKNRLEERRRTSQHEDLSESMAKDVKQAVKVAHDASEFLS